MDNFWLYKILSYLIINLFFFTFLSPAHSQVKQAEDSVLSVQKVFSAEEIIRGERLFYGLAYPDDRSVNCVKCHNTSHSDTLNWNPDALEISQKYLEKTALDLSKILLRPSGKKLSEVHGGFQLTNEDIVLIKGYMDKFVSIGLKHRKPVVTNLLLMIISFILFSLAITDIIIRTVSRNTKINWIVMLISSVVIIWILASNAIAFGRSKGYSPDQPIKFSHFVHAGQNKTDCNYCHYTARSGKTAGIPPGYVCRNCHFLVKSGTRSGVTEINKVTAAYDSLIAVKWVRIYRLPDFVFFSHAQHVAAGGLSCEGCHGDVKSMDRLYQVPDLSMGWCLKCHDSRKVNLKNEYYKTYFSELNESVMAGKTDSVMAASTGGRDCGVCHY